MDGPRITAAALLLALTVAGGAALWAHADPAAPLPQSVPAGGAPQEARPIRMAAGMSMDQAIKMAEQRFKARVVRAEAQQSGDRTVYVLRLLNEHGRVWTVRVDASNGEVL